MREGLKTILFMLPRLLRFLHTVILRFALPLFKGCHLHLAVGTLHLFCHFNNLKKLHFVHVSKDLGQK